MTNLPVFPIFTLSVESDCVIAGGGGGDTKYGKENGIVIYDLTTYKGLTYYKTNNVVNYLISWRSSCKPNNVIIAACTLKDLHVIEYANNLLQLLFILPRRCKNVYFKDVLFAICDKGLLMGSCDNFPQNLEYTENSSAEEFVYDLICKNGIFSLNKPLENIPQTWHSVFFVNNKVHKVVFINNNYSFMLNNKRYTFEHEIMNIMYINEKETLVFFIKCEDMVYIMAKKGSTKVNVPQITCLVVDKGEIYAGTGSGKIFCVENVPRQISKYRMPITGLVKRNNYVYFTSIDGCIDRRYVKRKMYLLIMIILVLILAILVQKRLHNY